MRISDWSSDVCSSNLTAFGLSGVGGAASIRASSACQFSRGVGGVAPTYGAPVIACVGCARPTEFSAFRFSRGVGGVAPTYGNPGEVLRAASTTHPRHRIVRVQAFEVRDGGVEALDAFVGRQRGGAAARGVFADHQDLGVAIGSA